MCKALDKAMVDNREDLWITEKSKKAQEMYDICVDQQVWCIKNSVMNCLTSVSPC